MLCSDFVSFDQQLGLSRRFFGYSLTSGLFDELLKPSSKMDPMLVSVDPVEHRRKMYYVVKKKFFGQYGEVADDNLLPL